ncbi:MAG: hypothetical protein EHM40_21960, partial [Chloroflexi bacterium]
MNEQVIPTTRTRLFGRPGIPTGLVALIIIIIFTQASALLMNQPRAYWLDHQYASARFPFSFLLGGGPWLFLLLAGLYLVVVGLLLARLQVVPGLVLATLLSL